MKKIILFILTLTFSIQCFAKNGFAHISGNIADLKDNDIVRLTVSKYGSPAFDFDTTSYFCRVVHHSFHFTVGTSNTPLQLEMNFRDNSFPPGTSAGFFNVYQKLNIRNGLIEDGDNVFITSSAGGLVFSGMGAAKFKVSQYLNQAYLSRSNDGLPSSTKSYFEYCDAFAEKSLHYLNSVKGELSHPVFVLLQARALAFFYGKGFGSYFVNWRDSSRTKVLDNLNSYQPHLPMVNPDKFNREDLLQYADSYAASLISRYTFDSCYVNNRPFIVKDCYKYIVNHYQGALRERLVTDLLYKNRKATEDISGNINDALTYVHNPDFIAVLQKVKANHIVGAPACNFSLPDPQGNLHSLDEYKGKIILVDFWFTGCGNCIRVAPYLARIEKNFSGKPVVFLSINFADKKAEWMESLKSGKYSSEYATNLFSNVNGLSYSEPVIKYYNVDGGPTLIMIDKNGKLMNNVVDPRIDNGKDITDKINTALTAN